MTDATDWPDILKHVYWIGGGSGAAKSTVARRLARDHDLLLYSTDEAMADHGSRYKPEVCPQLEQFKRMSMDERWVNRDPAVMLDTFHWYRGEGFELILEDLGKISRDRKVLAEGFRLLPRLVLPVLASPHQAVWLLPTPEFREKAFAARGTTWDIPDRTSRPEKALANLLARDAMFTDRLEEDTRALGGAVLAVDGSRPVDDLVSDVATHFRLTD